MGRAPCCDKANVKKGPWSPEEDAKLKSYIEKHGTGGNWIALPQKIGLKRCGKSCRLRWLNYLRPNIKHGGFSQEEDNIICSLYISIGSRWSIIAAQLPGRTDNDIKNYWNTRLKKKLLGKQRKEKHEARTAERSTKQNSDICQGGGPMGYGPQLSAVQPITTTYSNEETVGFNDHASIRKLLIKLGGRFSNADQNNIDVGQCTLIDESLIINDQPLLYDHNYSIDSSAQIQIPLLNGSTCGGAPFVSDFDIIGDDHHHHHMMSSMLHDANHVNLTAEMYENPDHQKLPLQAGLEFFYDDIINSTAGNSTCGESNINDWGDQMMNSNLVFSAAVSNNNQGFLQGSTTTLEEFAVEKARYPGNQSSS